MRTVLRITFWVCIGCLVVALGACGSEPTPPPPAIPPPPPPAPPPAPPHLVFITQPAAVEGMVPISPAPRVAVVDTNGNIVTSDTRDIQLSLGFNPRGARISGTLRRAAVNGVAEFPDLRIDRLGGGLTLIAEAAGVVATTTSDSFAVHATFRSVAAGAEHSCGTSTSGFIFCWGANENAQLGDGTKTSRPAPVLAARQSGLRFESVHPGGAHTCGFAEGGVLVCWGNNTWGALGGGSFDETTEPVTVSVPGVTFTAVALGFLNTCALATTGTIYCWGFNYDGSLGDSTTETRATPAPVAAPDGVRFSALAAGSGRSCGISDVGAVYCWGSQVVLTPTLVADLPDSAPFISIATSGGHVCAATMTGQLVCWGGNDYGQLGDGTTLQRGPVPVAPERPWRAPTISPSGHHTCARSNDTFLCWGNNAEGQLTEAATAPYEPAPIAISMPPGVVFDTVVAGGRHGCGLTSAGKIYCWGDNLNGQLGDGTNVSRRIPTPIVQ